VTYLDDRAAKDMAGVLVVALLGAIALWVMTLKKQIRTRRAAEAALVESEQRLRVALSAAEVDLFERRKAEGRLRLLAHALQSANDCITVTDASDHILYVNKASLRTYEYMESELLGQHIGIVYDSPRATRQDGWRGVVRNRSKTGRVFLVSLVTSMVYDEQGRAIAVVGVARDLTQERAAEELLQRSEARYREVVENNAPPASGTILFVEGDESLRALGVRALRHQGYIVLAARNATEALKIAERPGVTIDLLLTDIEMPGLHGQALAGQLQESSAHVNLKVLYTSGYASRSTTPRDHQAASAEFVQKPFTPESLARKVREVLDRA